MYRGLLIMAVTAIGLTGLTGLTQPAAALDDTAYASLNKAAVEQHILPRYEQMQAAMAALGRATAAYCSAPDTGKIGNLRAAYHAGVDAWQSIQHVRFGPVDLFFRSQRIAFWPDPRNTIGRQMAEILSEQDGDAVAADSLGRGSVAVQGLPALERLVFGNDAAKLASGPDAAFRCRYASAITMNLATMAKETLMEWQGGFARQMQDTGSGNARYPAAKDATLDLFKSLYTAVELVADHKLARPLGASVDQARPRLSEAWRSERSLRNVLLNLEAARDLYVTAFSSAVLDKAVDSAIRTEFAAALDAAKVIGKPLEQTVEDRGERGKVEALAGKAATLKTLLVQRLPAVLDIPVGFNALDGD